MTKGSFLQFLTESNSAGQTFELKIAKNVLTWLKSMNLDSKFNAYHMKSSDIENDSLREEDFSDICVENLESGLKFFIECKEESKANVVTIQFDISEDFRLIPVEGRDRTEVQDECAKRLADDLLNTIEYEKFIDFLQSLPDGMKNLLSLYYFNREDVTDEELDRLIEKYNDLVDAGKTEDDCKKFKKTVIRESSRNLLACALCWRLDDPRHTWDIIHLESIDYYTDLIRMHYLQSKIIQAKYLQLEDDLFKLGEDNPLNVGCPQLPPVIGNFTLKFTPRFGTGSMYITPRSVIKTKLESPVSFKTKEKFPKLSA